MAAKEASQGRGAGRLRPPADVRGAFRGIDIFQPTLNGETLIVVHSPGKFSGDVGLRGTGSVVRMRAEDGEVLAIDESHLRTIVQDRFGMSECSCAPSYCARVADHLAGQRRHTLGPLIPRARCACSSFTRNTYPT